MPLKKSRKILHLKKLGCSNWMWPQKTFEVLWNVAAYLYYAPLMILLCADANDDASVHSDCIVPQSFPINRPFLFHFNVHTSEINKNSYFYSVSKILCFGIIFLRVLQHVISTNTLVLSPASTSVSSGKKFYHTSLYLH